MTFAVFIQEDHCAKRFLRDYLMQCAGRSLVLFFSETASTLLRVDNQVYREGNPLANVLMDG